MSPERRRLVISPPAALALAVAIALPALADDPATDAIDEPPITEIERAHWSFEPLERPAVPDVQRVDWPRSPIDRFTLAKLAAAGLDPLPEAGRVTLLRRVSFDLTGLPPTPAAIDDFLADDSPDAYEKVVDRLLASDAYGQRWAQHWLDLARFAETDGFEHDNVRPEAWRYRDWVIDALAADMPYDRFVRLQLAGDVILAIEPDSASPDLRSASPGLRSASPDLRSGSPAPAATKIATGFLLCGPDMPDINLQEERRHSFLNDMTATVGSVILGLQFGCAQCHDHKYDPISQADFYRLRAFFDPQFVFEKNKIARLRAEPSKEASYLMLRGDFRRKGPQLQPAFPRIVNYGDLAPEDLQPETGADKVPLSDLRRRALAEWLTRPEHPLTTRVIVNRLWQHHFGEGLSRTPSDFGLMGEEPTHPELLDWLATELPRRGWSLKQMHRLMVTSATYRQASRPSDPEWTPETTARAASAWKKSNSDDPANRLLARMNRRRLEGEAIRDAMLAAAESLSDRRGGPGVRPPLPQELLVTLLKNQWPVTPDVNDHDRRSIYLFVRRNLRYPLFDVFDRPDTNQSCPRRNTSTIAPQALMLLNSEFSLSAAKRLSGFILAQSSAPDTRSVRGTRPKTAPRREIELCYLRTLGRRPTAEEQRIAADFLTREADVLRRNNRDRSSLAVPDDLPDDADVYQAAALTEFCLAVFNFNEFVYLD